MGRRTSDARSVRAKPVVCPTLAVTAIARPKHVIRSLPGLGPQAVQGLNAPRPGLRPASPLRQLRELQVTSHVRCCWLISARLFS